MIYLKTLPALEGAKVIVVDEGEFIFNQTEFKSIYVSLINQTTWYLQD